MDRRDTGVDGWMDGWRRGGCMDRRTQEWADGWTAGGELHVWTEGHGWMDRRTAGGELDVQRERHGWTDGWMAGGEVDVRTEGHRGGQTHWVQSSELGPVFLVHILCPLHPESDRGRRALVSSLSQRNRGPERHSPPLCQHSRGVPCTRGAVTVAFARPMTVLANESHRVRAPPPRLRLVVLGAAVMPTSGP